jgi:Leucine-rich repeat (LRR) protein
LWDAEYGDIPIPPTVAVFAQEDGSPDKLEEINFPDSAFSQCIADTAFTFVDELTILSCTGLGIADVTGIEALGALTDLDLSFNQLTSVDVSANTALYFLDLSFNQLTSIDVSANTALNYLHLSDNQLTSIDVSANTTLTDLDLSLNPNIPCSEIEAIDAQFPDLEFRRPESCDIIPPEPGPEPGQWAGKTGQDFDMGFVVAPSGQAILSVSYKISSGGVTLEGSGSSGGGWPIESGAFHIELDSFCNDITFSGEFTSDIASSGSLRVDFKNAFSCGGVSGFLETDWTAEP